MSASAAASLSVVLVHGGFVDGSGWQGVYSILQQHGHRVSIVQNPTISLDDDVAVTRRVIAAQPGPVVLVGHSYGGVVITQAGNDPKVAALVYIAAFAPDRGESVATLIALPAIQTRFDSEGWLYWFDSNSKFMRLLATALADARWEAMKRAAAPTPPSSS